MTIKDKLNKLFSLTTFLEDSKIDSTIVKKVKDEFSITFYFSQEISYKINFFVKDDQVFYCLEVDSEYQKEIESLVKELKELF